MVYCLVQEQGKCRLIVTTVHCLVLGARYMWTGSNNIASPLFRWIWSNEEALLGSGDQVQADLE